MSRIYTGVNCQYCNNLNDINTAIETHDENWEGLTDAHDIISITYDTNHGCYVVFWKAVVEVSRNGKDNNMSNIKSGNE